MKSTTHHHRNNSPQSAPFFGPIPKSNSFFAPTIRRQQTLEEEAVQMMPLMRKTENGAYQATPRLTSQLSQSKGGGSPLSVHTLNHMNQAFRTDFSNVRVHTDSQAQEMSQGIQAKAFTHGSDVYFNRGQYSPESSEGKKLLAHELTHVVQQGESIQREIVQRDKEPAKKEPSASSSTKVEVVAEQDFVGGKGNVRATTKSTANQQVLPGVSGDTSVTTSGESTSGTAEFKAKDKKTGLLAAAGVKAEDYTDPTKPDSTKFYLKLGGQWKLFESSTVRIESSSSLELSKNLAFSADGKAVFIPNGRFSPEIAVRFLANESRMAGTLQTGMEFDITKRLSLRTGVSIGIDSNRKLEAKGGVGFTLEF